MIPRSLRWGDTELLEWFQFFNGAGISLLNFLIDKKRKKVFRLNKDISEIKDKLAPFMQDEAYKLYNQELREIITMEREEQKSKKRKKYLRDLEDYKSSKVFKWQLHMSGSDTVGKEGPIPLEGSHAEPSVTKEGLRSQEGDEKSVEGPRGGGAKSQKPPPPGASNHTVRATGTTG